MKTWYNKYTINKIQQHTTHFCYITNIFTYNTKFEESIGFINNGMDEEIETSLFMRQKLTSHSCFQNTKGGPYVYLSNQIRFEISPFYP
jgi:hypothetical protein